jgi:ABC-type branched-subunit amino acid transport system ATPase component
VLRFVGASHTHDQLATNLSYGDQRAGDARGAGVGAARSPARRADRGHEPQESDDLTGFMRQLRDEKRVSILLIEHDMKVIMGVSEHITVLDHGEKIAEAPGGRANPQVIEAYLGSRLTDDAMLEVDDIHTYYGNIEALKGVSLTVEEGECVTLIGSNGAGKSTTLRSISALTPARSGEIRFRGATSPAWRPRTSSSSGSRSRRGPQVLQRMTVRENLDMGAYLRRDKDIDSDLDRVFDLFPRLKEREKQKAGTMSGGEQQMLAIGRR